MVTVSYDKEVDMTYVKFKERPAFRTVEHDDEILLDLDRKDWLVGIEFFGSPGHLLSYLDTYSELRDKYSEIAKLLKDWQ